VRQTSKVKPASTPSLRPLLLRLDIQDKTLLEMKAALAIQFERIAQIQAQLDKVLKVISKHF
jgi:uncharacterized coiled-coil protein SlyX